MKTRWVRMWMASSLVMLAGLFLGISAHAGEKKEIAGTDKQARIISQTVINVTDRPDHQLAQRVIMINTKESTDPDFQNLVVTGYEQSDSVKGSGSHKGYRIQRHENGDKSYVQYEGTHTLDVKKVGAHELSFNGTWQATGGKGKFANITGSGTYKGRQTKEGMTSEWKGEVEY